MGAPLSRATQPLEGEQDSEQPCKRLRPELREEDRTVVDPFEGEDRAFEAVPLHWQSSSAPTEHQQAHSLPGAGQAVLAIESHAHDRFNEVAKAELLARGLQNKAVQVAMRPRTAASWASKASMGPGRPRSDVCPCSAVVMGRQRPTEPAEKPTMK